MTGILAEWIVVLAFFLTVIGLMFAEAAWLSRRGWAGFGKAFAFSALSDFIGLAIGFFVVFVVLVVALMFTLDGSIQKSRMGEPALIAALIFSALFVPVLLTICKLIFLSVLKVQTGKSAWAYAPASSILILTVSLGVPILIGYFLFRSG